MPKSSTPPTPPAPGKPPGGVYILNIALRDDGKTQDVTFVCQQCGKNVTRTQRIGFLPRFCEDCAAERKRTKTVASNKKKRAERKAEGKE